MAEIDYRSLLKRYIAAVILMEGVDYIGEGFTTEEENEELRKISAELTREEINGCPCPDRFAHTTPKRPA